MTIWIATIVGSVLTAAGVSQWLPLSREYRKLRQSKLNRLELLRRVEKLIAVEERPRRILTRTLEEFIDLGDYRFGRVYTLSKGARRFHLVHNTAKVNDDRSDHMLMSETDILHQWIDDQNTAETMISVPLADGGSQSVTLIPIRNKEQLYGIFTLYHNDEATEHNQAVPPELVLIADILARKILLDRHRLACELRSRRTQWRDEIAAAMDDSKDFKANISAVGQDIMRGINADFLSLAVVIDHRVMHRFSMLSGGSLLQEAGLNLHRQTTHVSQLHADGKALVFDDIQAVPDTPIDAVIRDNGMRSLLALPIERLGKRVAAVTVASRMAGRFTVRERSMLRSLVPVLSDAIADEIMRTAIALRDKSISRLGLLIDEAAEAGDLDNLYIKAAEVISSELQATVVRITTLDDDPAFLKSRALTTMHKAPVATPADGTMIMSLLPYHMLVRDTGRVMLINHDQKEKKLSEAESLLVFCQGVQSVLLAPIKSGSQVTGFISLADVRSWERSQYRHKDILLVRSVASLLGLAELTVGNWRADVSGIKRENDSRIGDMIASKRATDRKIVRRLTSELVEM
ncbi:MAG TPA: hypothetical protein PLF13_06125 [candidate division Zixibacteria bacterium]|nr:hypothetical protein [candidate division Zixibacteria bacterium]